MTDAHVDSHELVLRLTSARPVPNPAFRGDLRRHLLSDGVPAPRPPRLRLLVAAYASSGAALVALGALSAAGAGPFG